MLPSRSLRLAAGALLLASIVSAQPPPRQDKGGPPGGQEGRPAPGTILPARIQEQIKLTPEQKKQLEELQKATDQKLERVLTIEQKDQLKRLRERGPGGPPRGGPPAKGADRPADARPREEGEPKLNELAVRDLTSGIQWFATLDSGLQEAERTGRPILLISGTPHCAGVSGMW